MKDVNGPSALEPELDELRDILLGTERDLLVALHDRVTDPSTRAADVADVLPEALARASRLPQALGGVARPVVESALEASVRRDPTLLGELLFPVMGPAIRRAVSESIASFMRSLNQGLERSVSFRSLRWRFEAWRTGKSFGEVVLRHTFRFRAEQVFLIHKDTGVLLHHVVQPALAVVDADVVSSMLSAIQDFVRDSFRLTPESSLEQIEMGDLTIWVENGPRALVAAVVRGTAPAEYRDVLASTVESVHARYSSLLQRFNGDVSPFQAAEPLLDDCLVEELEEGATPSLWRAYLAVVVLLAALGALSYWWVQERTRWQRAVATLRAEPGLVVVDADQGFWRHRVVGLRDTYASEPMALMARAGVDVSKVDAEWRPVQSGDATIAERRAVDLLKPPPEVKLTVRDGVLHASGRASTTWTFELLRLGRFIAGIDAIDTSELVDIDRLTLEEDRRQLSPFTVGFLGGVSQLDGDALAGLTQYAARLAELCRRAAQIDSRLEIVVAGASDSTGDPAANLDLARLRSEFVRSTLTANGVPIAWVRGESLPPDTTVSDVSLGARSFSRFATVTVQFAEGGPRP